MSTAGSLPFLTLPPAEVAPISRSSLVTHPFSGLNKIVGSVAFPSSPGLSPGLVSFLLFVASKPHAFSFSPL